MKTIHTMLLFFMLVTTVSLNAYDSAFDGRILGIYLGYNQDKGYSFSVSDELRSRILTFATIEDSTLLKRYNLKEDASLVGKSFIITYDSSTNFETGGVNLTLISLKRASAFKSSLGKSN